MPFELLPGGGQSGALIAPSGTSIPMAQASAPNGWTSSAVSDTSLRYNSGTGGSGGGTVNWSTWNFGGTVNVNTFTLNVSQLAAHNHTDSGHSHTVIDPAHAHTANTANGFWGDPSGGGIAVAQPGVQAAAMTNFASTNASGTGISINTGTANIQNNGSGAGITPSLTTPQVKYIDHILAVKS